MNLRDEQTRPDWELLTSWIAVVETGSVLKAARLLEISQAAVSQRVKQLEKIFATQLLDRSTRPAQVTSAGQRLFENAKDLIARADEMVENVRSVSRAKRMIVRFGCVDSFAATIGPVLIKALSSSSHQIRLWSGITPAMDGLLAARQLDLAVTTSTGTTTGIARARLFDERYYVVLPAKFETARLGTLTDVSRHLQFIRYSSRSLIGSQVDEYLQHTEDALERTCEFDATDPLLSLVASGMGFALSTPLCIWQSRQYVPGIRIVPLSSFTRKGRPYPGLARTFHLAYRQAGLGTLPGEVRDLVRTAVRSRISAEIGRHLGLGKDVLRTPEERD